MPNSENRQMSTNRIDSIIALIIEEAKSRSQPKDYVSRLYRVQIDIMRKLIDIMALEREEERKDEQQ